MFSDLDDAFTALRDRAPEPPFAPAGTVRRRGRRRTHRQVAVAAATVVGLAVGAGALVAGPLADGRVEPAASATAGPTRSPATSPPVRRAVPNEQLLQPTDVPTGFRVGDDRDSEYVDFPVPTICVDVVQSWESRAHGRASRTIVFAGEDAMRAKAWLHDEQVQQSVMVFDAGWAARGIAEYRTWIDTCAVRNGMTFGVVHRDFGGDESVLYRVEWPPGSADSDFYLAIVRAGDRVTTVRIGKAFEAGTARDLATKAATRLAS